MLSILSLQETSMLVTRTLLPTVQDLHFILEKTQFSSPLRSWNWIEPTSISMDDFLRCKCIFWGEQVRDCRETSTLYHERRNFMVVYDVFSDPLALCLPTMTTLAHPGSDAISRVHSLLTGLHNLHTYPGYSLACYIHHFRNNMKQPTVDLNWPGEDCSPHMLSPG